MSFMNKLKSKISSFILDLFRDEIEKEIIRLMRKKPTYNCITSDTTVLLSEARVENLSRCKEKITIGHNSYIRGELLVYAHSGQINIGDWTYIGAGTRLWSMASIFVGNRVLISHNVNIIDNTAHSKDPSERHQHFKNIVTSGHPKKAEELPGIYSDDIVIEDDVWIGFGVTILKGVRIGANSIIYAGSTVLNDVPPNSTYRNKIEPIVNHF
jgi:acetyltransferase-like isoleucine patch superfamily enzyme